MMSGKHRRSLRRVGRHGPRAKRPGAALFFLDASAERDHSTFMKSTNIQIGKKYMLSLGRRGAVAVTIVARVGSEWCCWCEGGTVYYASARRLSPCPVTDRDGNLLGYAHEGVGQ